MESTDWREERFEARDGALIAFRRAGAGPTVMLIHGFLADGMQNWIGPGIADRILASGFSVIMPDLRGHGASAAPTSPEAWPKDVLCDDQFDLLERLGVSEYRLVGYSLGARTAARMLVRGARPKRAVLGGMGASGIMEAGARAAMFEDAIRFGVGGQYPEAARRIEFMIRQGGLSREALLGVLSSFVPTTKADLVSILTPTLVVAGRDDHDNGSVEELAGIMPRARPERVPGDHLTAVAEPALAEAITRFLAEGD